MTVLRTFAAILATISMTLQASACCLFPFLPTYAPVYGGYGCGYRGFGFAAPAYYSAGYYGASSACNTCCTTSCCPTSTCGSSCSSCVPTEVRNKAVPDPISNEKSDAAGGEKTFRGGSDRGRGVGEDDFGRGVGGYESGRAGSTDGDKDWSASGDGGTGSEGSRTPFGGMNDEIPGRGGFESSNRPPLGGLEGGEGTGTGDEGGSASEGDGGIINHSANKAPINLPLHDESDGEGDDDTTNAGDNSQTEQGNTEQNASGADADVDPGAETDANEFLGPENEDTDATDSSARLRLFSQRDVRSSHFGVISAPRLARKSRAEDTSRSVISSSRTKQRPVRWISLPSPDGRVRS